MLWMKNLKMNSKLVVMVLIPMIGLLYFSISAVIAKINDRTELGQLETKTKLLVKTIDLIHELQKEQGITVSYYANHTEIQRNQLLEQRKYSNQSIDNLKQYVHTISLNELDANFVKNLTLAIKMLDKLDLEREFIDKQNTDETKILTYYGDTLGSFFILTNQMNLASSHIEMTAMLSAFHNFFQSKAALSRERDFITSILQDNQIQATRMYSLGLLEKERQLYSDNFASNASLDWLTQYKSIVKGQVVDEVNRIRYKVMDGAAGKSLDVDPHYWYQQSTNVIDLMKQAEDQYAFAIIGLLDQRRSGALSWLVFMILINLLLILVSLSLLIQVWFTFQEMMAEKERQYWLKAELARLTELSLGMTDLQQLVKMLISEISKLIEVGQGVFYVKETRKNAEHTGDFILLGSYAYKERKNISDHFRLGEGLIGQCALEKKPILLTQVPDEYIQISSGLGECNPLTIFVMPIIFEEEVVAVIELASFKAFTPIQQNLLELLSTPLGVIINSAASRQRTEESLLESLLLAEKAQLLAEEAQIQQEELRVSNEELEEQTKMLKHSEERLKLQSEELQVINDEMAVKTKRLETQTMDIIKQNEMIQLSKDDLELKANELELASNYKSEFLANMSHELRTPLNSLLILAKLLANNMEGNLTEDQIESAQIIYSGGLNLLTLINDILDLSKVEAGKLNVLPEVVKLESIVHNLKYEFNVIAQDKGLQFELQIEEAVPWTLITDGQRTEQILKNFLSNAFKFTSMGTVSLRICRPTADFQFINKNLSADNTVAFIVRDTGIGIVPNKQKAIFESFQQADGSTSRKYGGTGLGLTISRELAKLLGGEIHLVSQKDVGSTFTLILPLDMNHVSSIGDPMNVMASSKDIVFSVVDTSETMLSEAHTELSIQAAAAATAVAPQAIQVFIADDRNEIDPYLNEKVILIVEDDKSFAKVLLDMSVAKGFKCIVAADGFSGIQLIKKYMPSAVLLDLGLPDMDGLKLLELLKHDSETRHIPVHIITGKEDKQASLEKGAVGFLTKPISATDFDSVFARIEGILQERIQRVLVIEDDAPNQKAIYEMLRNKKVEIHGVQTGEEGLERLRLHDYDCMILDLKLPDMSGFELLTRLVEIKKTQLPPIIVYTGKELTQEEYKELNHYTGSIVIKGAYSPDRLMDEVSLFLHNVNKMLPFEQRHGAYMLQDGDETLKGRKILLVDDDLRNTFALSKLLQHYEMDVIMADNGKLALEMLEQVAGIELVIMDIMMPVMDGYEAMRRIRQNPQFNKLPIIALTANAMLGDREKCIEGGANDYLTKPIDTDNLLSLLRVWLFN
ncbi:Signal transduction histidine kinase [Paenibacillus sp. 1_12]|uniref:response regulator n=1 Tax=Paenibacillus sp. 1_12 TaxID=1566278 RepID=UPI0008E8369E|nr:response regulator [Paenibacillus sp. 1_12]SFL38480.1 Signal transduction histidine kinase [Paenibacillus sp. 1_12]